MEEQPDGHEAGMAVVPDRVEEVTLRRFQDKGRDVAMVGGQMGSEGGSDADPVGNDLMGGDVAGCSEVGPGGFGVLSHSELIGVSVGAVPVAAVVEGKDVDAEIMKPIERGVEVREGAVSAGEEEDRRVGVVCAGGGWKPTSC